MTTKAVTQKVNKALDELYEHDQRLFNEGLCERCINHRFAVCLERQEFGASYRVDCEYNKSHAQGETSKKAVSNPRGNYIDIIISERRSDGIGDLVCFETKMAKNRNGRVKDRDNLKILTSGLRFQYQCGFYVIYGETRDKVIIERYEGGSVSTSY